MEHHKLRFLLKAVSFKKFNYTFVFIFLIKYSVLFLIDKISKQQSNKLKNKD